MYCMLHRLTLSFETCSSSDTQFAVNIKERERDLPFRYSENKPYHILTAVNVMLLAENSVSQFQCCSVISNTPQQLATLTSAPTLPTLSHFCLNYPLT